MVNANFFCFTYVCAITDLSKKTWYKTIERLKLGYQLQSAKYNIHMYEKYTYIRNIDKYIGLIGY